MTDPSSDRWPPLELSPTGFERLAVELLRGSQANVTGFEVQHLETIEGVDGSYVMDGTLRFEVAGMEFLVLVECKRHSRPVEREDLMVLNDKLRSTNAHKGIFFSTSGYQRGALDYARKNKMALVRVVDGAFAYETKSGSPGQTNIGAPPWLADRAGLVTAYEVYFAPTLEAHKELTEQPHYTLDFFLHGLDGLDYVDGRWVPIQNAEKHALGAAPL